MTDSFEKTHSGKFSGSRMGCKRMMALSVLGYKSVISKKLKSIFEEGQEHDEVMKEEAYEEWDDYDAPEPHDFIIKTSNGGPAKIVATPDGIRPDEIVEFKSLSSNNFNSLKTVEDLDETPLFRKYMKQMQLYCGLFGKKKIRLRIKNKRNLKTRDIMIPFDPKIYNQLLADIKEVQEYINDNKLPPPDNCSPEELKFCRLSKDCSALMAKEAADQPAKPFTTKESKQFFALAFDSRSIKLQIDKLTAERDGITLQLKALMREHGQREVEDGNLRVKYGFRTKLDKDKEAIQRLVEDGTIPAYEREEEYLVVEEV
jgi:hypothetical protein